MKDCNFIGTLMCGFLGLTLTLASCGGGGGGVPPYNTGAGQIASVSGAGGRTAVLKSINITPNDPLGINSRTRVQFTAIGSYSDNSVQDITALVVWTSSDSSIASMSNETGSLGLATAVSKGYCSISAMSGGVSGSTVIGVN
jgi:hypothetical protein